jgi:hypothetical protein
MDLTNLPGPDTVVKDLLVGMFGPTAAIVVLFVVANFVWSWIGAAQSTYRIGRRSARTASYAYAHVMSMPRVSVAVGTMVTVVVLVLQTAWLWSTTRIANSLSYVWESNIGMEGPDWSGLVSYTRWDWISTGYLLLTLVALVACYAAAFGVRRRDGSWISTFVVALPLMLPWGVVALLGSVLMSILGGITWLGDRMGVARGPETFVMSALDWKMVVIALIVSTYTVAAKLALGSTVTVARFWRS